MINDKKIREAQLLWGALSLNQMHLTPADVVGAVLNFGDVAAMTKIVLIQAVFKTSNPKSIYIYISIKIA